MRYGTLIGGFITALVTGQAIAACPTAKADAASAADIQTLLTTVGRYACGTDYGGRRFNQYLVGGVSGQVWDYKKGPTDPIDKSKQLGTYTIEATGGTGPDLITYTYGSTTYSYAIRPAGSDTGTKTFCQVSASGSPNNIGQDLTVYVSGSLTTCFTP